ncbi:MAG TPA: hypothetical protein VGA04_05160 [Streptosporangiaceae bacterium]
MASSAATALGGRGHRIQADLLIPGRGAPVRREARSGAVHPQQVLLGQQLVRLSTTTQSGPAIA